MSEVLVIIGVGGRTKVLAAATHALEKKEYAWAATFVDYFRVRIDPLKSDETDSFVRFDFADGTSAGLHVRRAMAEFVAVPDAYHRKPDVIVSMSGETWARLYLSQATPEDLIKSRDLKVTGDSAEASRLINLFDRYSPERAVVIPSAALNHM